MHLKSHHVEHLCLTLLSLSACVPSSKIQAENPQMRQLTSKGLVKLDPRIRALRGLAKTSLR